MKIICLLMAFLFFQESAFAYQIGNIRIKLLGSISEIYDDNISYVKDNPKADFSTNASVGLNAKYESKLSSMTLSGNIKQQAFAKNRNFNNTSEDFTFNFLKELSKRDRFSLKNTIVHAEEPRSFDDQFGDTSQRYSYYRNRFTFAYNRDITKQFSANLKYYNDIDDNSRSDASDSNMNKVEAGMDYALSSDFIIMGSYYYSKRTFDLGSSSSSNTLLGGLRKYFTRKLYVYVLTGMDMIKSFDGTRFAKPIIIASLTDEIDENSGARLVFSKQYYANSFSQNLFNSWRVSCDFVRQLFKRLSLSLSAFYGKGEYKSINTKQGFIGGNAGLIYNIRDNIKATISYGYSKNTSNISTNEYTKNIVSFAITIEF